MIPSRIGVSMLRSNVTANWFGISLPSFFVTKPQYSLLFWILYCTSRCCIGIGSVWFSSLLVVLPKVLFRGNNRFPRFEIGNGGEIARVRAGKPRSEERRVGKECGARGCGED